MLTILRNNYANGSARERLLMQSDRADLTLGNRKSAWRSWWDGGKTGGPIASRWDVHGWPTIIVLDETGVIRFKHRNPSLISTAAPRVTSQVVIFKRLGCHAHVFVTRCEHGTQRGSEPQWRSARSFQASPSFYSEAAGR